MKFDELLITTGVDALVKLVKEKKRIDVELVAQLLNIPAETIEEWSRVLEEEGIIKINYRLTKVYLTWVTPTEEELVEETESLKKDEAEINEEIQKLKDSMDPEIKQTESLKKSFDELYATLYPRLKELEEKISSFQGPETTGKKVDYYIQRIEELKEKVESSQGEIREYSKDLDRLYKTFGKEEDLKSRADKFDRKIAELKGLENELIILRKTTEQQQKSLPSAEQLPSLRDLKERHEAIKKEFLEMKRRTTRLRDDMVALDEGAEIIKTVGASIKKYEKKLDVTQKEVKPLLKDIEVLAAKAKQMKDQLQEDTDKLERFSDSINIAKGILDRFPSEKRVMEELEKIKSKENAIEEKSKSLDTLLKVVGGSKVAAAEASEVMKKIDDKIAEVREEYEEFSSILEQEKSTLMTYQKIKEKLAPSLDNYKKKMDELGGSLKALRSELAQQGEEVEHEMEKVEAVLGADKGKEIMAMAREVKEKKELMDEIRESLESMSASAANLNKRVNLVSKEASLLQLRIDSSTAPSTQLSGEEEKVRTEIKLTRDEEEEFKRKRKELRDLIKRLWEDESSGQGSV
jgi:chromosome segregation ATPase